MSAITPYSPPPAMTTSRPRPGTPETPVDPIVDRMPPHDLSAEAAVLGSMILDPDVVASVCVFLQKPEQFFSEANQTTFRVLLELVEKNRPIDAMILHSTLKTKNLLDTVGGIEYIKELANAVPTSSNAEYYAAIVKEKSMLRNLITACTAALHDCYESGDDAEVVLDRNESRVMAIADQKTPAKKSTTIVEVIQDVIESLDRQGERISGIPTGYIELDNLTSGFQRGDMIVIGARPSVGKTALALNIIEHVAVDLKKPCAIFSLEMSSHQLGQRMLCSRSGIDSQKLRSGKLSESDRERLGYAVSDISKAEINIDDTPSLSLLDLRSRARKLKLKHGIELFGIDYMQLMNATGRQENRQQEISTISRGIKALARELNVPIVCLSQLNRNSEQGERMPRTSDLRESGSIEQDADVILLLHREAVMHRGDQEWMDANPDKINEATLIVAKQRSGPSDSVRLTFLSGQTRFVNFNPGI